MLADAVAGIVHDWDLGSRWFGLEDLRLHMLQFGDDGWVLGPSSVRFQTKLKGLARALGERGVSLGESGVKK